MGGKRWESEERQKRSEIRYPFGMSVRGILAPDRIRISKYITVTKQVQQ